MSMNNMGKPISNEKRQEAYELLGEFGVEGSGSRWDCVQMVSEQLERDKPYEAMEIAQKYIDLTGAYRLFAVLLV